MILIGMAMAMAMTIDVAKAQAAVHFDPTTDIKGGFLDKQLAMEDGSEAFAFLLQATEEEVTETVIEGEGTDIVDTLQINEPQKKRNR